MLDQLTGSILSILSISFGGISIGGMIATLITVWKNHRKDKKETEISKEDMLKQIEVTKTSIENAFKDAVLPQKIKLDVSEKIEKPIKEAMAKMSETQQEALKKTNELAMLSLKILHEFTHVKKLPDEDQEKIEEALNNVVIEEVKI